MFVLNFLLHIFYNPQNYSSVDSAGFYWVPKSLSYRADTGISCTACVVCYCNRHCTWILSKEGNSVRSHFLGSHLGVMTMPRLPPKKGETCKHINSQNSLENSHCLMLKIEPTWAISINILLKYSGHYCKWTTILKGVFICRVAWYSCYWELAICIYTIYLLSTLNSTNQRFSEYLDVYEA